MTSERVVGIVQARMGSTRLPGKVLADLGGRPLLERLLERVGRAQQVDQVVLAVPEQKADDPLEALGDRLGVLVVRGSESDVLDRFHRAAEATEAHVVVRLTGDNPLVDGALVDAVVQQRAEHAADLVSSTLNPGLPYGISVEVVARAALDAAWREATAPDEREHVTRFILQRRDRFQVEPFASPPFHPELTVTVDRPEELATVRRVFDHFGDDAFSWQDAVALLADHPEWGGRREGVP